MNAGAIQDELDGVKIWRNRCDRQLVDLNRNFPTGNKPADTDCQNTEGAPTQPEVQAVMDVIKAFKPDRILSTHAIAKKKGDLEAKGGVFADPNQDPKSIALAKGMAQTLVHPEDRPFNKLTPTGFNPVYPGDKPGKVGAGTSLGAWAPTAQDPVKSIPVITMEAPEFRPLGSGGERTSGRYRGLCGPFGHSSNLLIVGYRRRPGYRQRHSEPQCRRSGRVPDRRLSSKNDLFRRIKFRILTAPSPNSMI